jgi:hypothetical protein
MLPGFIDFYKKGPYTYADYCIAKRIEGKKINDKEYLGRVLDKDKGIFQSRERGKFIFSLDQGYQEIEQGHLILDKESELIVNYGDAWLLEQVLNRTGFSKIFENIFPDPKFKDTLFSLIYFKLLDHGFAIKHAKNW